MFEKSLYDLIRGLRNHKGNEREYIQHSLRECRNEVKGSDMDLKATALLKLIYLEMFGHDMSWASFHVLEVMSSPKYLQKRVGYLGAVQSFRPDTEVLMLATNLLKKDMTSSLPTTISLPLVTLPHINTSSLAISLLSDLLPRLSHSIPGIRKKTVVALYRLALVYPDTLRPAWPKMKDLLMDEEEDSSVTAAIINVVCELGWRRPRDFLPLAPRLFELLVDGGNNWMAIKIIKLFATLTPFEPRLIKKLLPPLTNLIRTTPAMSLLYECINGIIQGGILEGTEGVREGDELASLCVGKLRGMIMVEGDPNLKYVALLAFNRIVTSHPHLVSAHQDVIMSCIDDPDISIRMQALDLGAGMVNSDNIVGVVERLMKQLRNAPLSVRSADNGRNHAFGVEPAADSDGEDPEETLRPLKETRNEALPLPTEYRVSIIIRILDMCSKCTYANVLDFEWYVEILLQLVRLLPAGSMTTLGPSEYDRRSNNNTQTPVEDDASCAIGWQLRNVAVRVSSVRPEAVDAANSLLVVQGGEVSTASTPVGGEGVLQFAAWIVGEYAGNLLDAHCTLSSLIHTRSHSLPPVVICAYLQSLPKVFVSILVNDGLVWNSERKTMVSLLLARIVHFLEPLAIHPNLEVQERSIEQLELMRVAVQAVIGHGMENEYGPLLLTKAIPALFSGSELNPVAPNAQEKVPQPDGLNLELPINQNLVGLLQGADEDNSTGSETGDFEWFYNQCPSQKASSVAAFDMLPPANSGVVSYQQTEGDTINSDTFSRKRIERQERNRDDPFYIASDDPSSGSSTPFHDILKNTNGEYVDVDSIPIMNLDLGDKRSRAEHADVEIPKQKRKHPKKFHITMDENIELNESAVDQLPRKGKRVINPDGPSLWKRDKPKRALLEVDSSGLGRFSLEGEENVVVQLDIEKRNVDDAEMSRALEEVERLRLEMQRASERVRAVDGVPSEGTLVKKKKKKQRKADNVPIGIVGSRTRGTMIDASNIDSSVTAHIMQTTKPKRKKKKAADATHDDNRGTSNGREAAGEGNEYS